MTNLAGRIDSFERDRCRPKLHVLCCWGAEDADAKLAESGLRVAANDLLVVVRKPALPGADK